jgi:hypothetical protein
MLEELFTKYGTDKGIWGYTKAYEKHLEARRYETRNVLEIGICGYRDIPNNVVGASLFAWRDYFPHAVIEGIDNDARFIFNDQYRIKTALADAYDQASLGTALYQFGHHQYDFICDDAVHDPLPQLLLAQRLWPFLKKGGTYAIEEACPYKCIGGKLEVMASIIYGMFNDAAITEYQTHKDERLLVLTKL